MKEDELRDLSVATSCIAVSRGTLWPPDTDTGDLGRVALIRYSGGFVMEGVTGLSALVRADGAAGRPTGSRVPGGMSGRG